MNSEDDNPSQVIPKALPLFLVKNLETAVEAVCPISPCPDNLIKKIPKNNKKIFLMLEKKNEEKPNKQITKIE